jgi:hypothetical protein
MNETKSELTSAKYKLEQPIVLKRIRHRRDCIKTSLLSSILLTPLVGRSTTVKCIGYSNDEKKVNSAEQTTEDFDML